MALSTSRRSGLRLGALLAVGSFVALSSGVGCGDGESNPSEGANSSGSAGAPSLPSDECPQNLTECGEQCTNLAYDPANCGECGEACGSGQVCSAGNCQSECGPGTTECNAACIDTQVDPQHCGDCDTACDTGQYCDDGACTDTSTTNTTVCTSGQIMCDGACVEPSVDNAFCGATGDCQGDNAGDSCAAGMLCNGSGECALSCQAGLVECDGVCIDPNTSNAFCGAQSDCQGANAGVTCDAGAVCNGSGACELRCQAGLIDCAGKCIDPNTDRAYCGASGDCGGDSLGAGGSSGAGSSGDAGVACNAGEVCNGSGACELSCQGGLVDCNGTCVDPNTSNQHCGASLDCQGANAGAACDAGEVCNGSGACEVSCQGGLVDCNGTCVDPNTSNQYCGASLDCQGANAGAACDAGEVCNGSGACELSCQGGLLDCNGTCVDPDTSNQHCGASLDCQGANAGDACAAGEVCNGSGECELSCQSGLLDCNGTCVDPDTSNQHCGASLDCQGANAGDACAAGEVCNGSGECELSCQSGLLDCNGNCVDPNTSNQHCGASLDCQGANAGVACDAGEVCNGSGECELSCQGGLVDCNGTCVDPDTSNQYCGASLDCQGANAGAACDAGEVCNGSGSCELSCQSGLLDCNGTCVDPDTSNQHCGASGSCQGAGAGDVCDAGEACNAGVCERACEAFNEPFADNGNGWTTGPEWAIGSATASSCGHSAAGQDPGADHTPGADNGVAGMVLGGCYSIAASHGDYCLTSPSIDTSTLEGDVSLTYWRHLHTDYPSFVSSWVDVSSNNGANWTRIFNVAGSQFVNDAAWVPQKYDVTAQKSSTFRVRFCESVGTFNGAVTGGGWNIDDVRVASASCL